MIQVLLVSGSGSFQQLAESLNEQLRKLHKKGDKVIDIKYQDNDKYCSALIIYETDS